MSSIAAQYVVDNEQNKSKYRLFTPKGKIKGLAVVERETIDGTSKFDFEWLRTEIFVPSISRKAKIELKNIVSERKEKDIMLEITYITPEMLKGKYLSTNEEFAVPSNKKVAKITFLGISPEYSGIKTLAKVETSKPIDIND